MRESDSRRPCGHGLSFQDSGANQHPAYPPTESERFELSPDFHHGLVFETSGAKPTSRLLSKFFILQPKSKFNPVSFGHRPPIWVHFVSKIIPFRRIIFIAIV